VTIWDVARVTVPGQKSRLTAAATGCYSGWVI